MDLRELTEAQGGVFSRAQARKAGYSAYRIGRRVGTETWTELYGGRVLHVGGAELTDRVRAHAAVLASQPGSVRGGPSAARAHGIEVPWPQPCVLVPPSRRRTPSGITVIREAVEHGDCCVLDEWLTTTKARTVLDCLLLLAEPEGRTFLDRALQLSWLTLDELVLRTQQRTCREGTPLLRRHIRVAAFGVRSEAERVLRRLLREAGITGWEVDHPLPGIGVLDFAFLAERLALEVDGRAWHSATERFQHDRTRQNALVTAGWTVLRFTWEDLTIRPAQVVATVQATLAGLRVEA
jgi:very-short-patch-repair endonuclease